MPFINSEYSSFFKNGHIQTILPNVLRYVNLKKPREEEIKTHDDDFLQLDWYETPHSNRLVVLCHGLEGNSRRTYMKGMAKLFLKNGYSVLAWNYRSCGSKMNNQLRFYHTGDIEDIQTVLNHVITLPQYQNIALIGFSMGGNIVLKYLGKSNSISDKIKCAVAISAPVDLTGSSFELMKKSNQFYMNRFLRKLRKKIEIKSNQYPQQLSIKDYHLIKNFKHFDDKYTAPIHGFDSAEDYWEKASSLPYLSKISRPSLLINAKNDSFLSPNCFPREIADNSDIFYLSTPNTGGHVGFWELRKNSHAEVTALNFINSIFYKSE